MTNKLASLTFFASILSVACMQTMAQDSCSSGFTADQLIGDNILTDTPAEGWTPQGGDVVELSDNEVLMYRASYNGTGRTRLSVKSQGSWSLVGDCTIELELSGGLVSIRESVFDGNTSLVERYGFQPEVAEFLLEGGISLAVINEEIVSRSITRGSAELDLASVRSVFRYTFDEQFLIDINWVGDAPVGSGESVSEQKLYTANSVQNVLPVDHKMRGSWSLPTKEPVLDIGTGEVVTSTSSDVFVFQAVGNQTKGLNSGKVFRWDQSSSGLSLFNDEESYVVIPFAEDGSVYSSLVTRRSNGEIKSKYVEWIAKAKGNAVNFTGRLVKKNPKIFISRINSWKQSAFDENNLLNLVEVFGYDFNADGTMARVFADTSGFSCIDTSSGCYSFETSDWTWEPSISRLVVQRLSGSEERTRTWDILSSAGGKTVVLESAFYKRDNNLDGDFNDEDDTVGPFFTNRLNILSNFDPRDLSEAWFNSQQPARGLRSRALSVDNMVK